MLTRPHPNATQFRATVVSSRLMSLNKPVGMGRRARGSQIVAEFGLLGGGCSGWLCAHPGPSHIGMGDLSILTWMEQHHVLVALAGKQLIVRSVSWAKLYGRPSREDLYIGDDAQETKPQSPRQRREAGGTNCSEPRTPKHTHAQSPAHRSTHTLRAPHTVTSAFAALMKVASMR